MYNDLKKIFHMDEAKAESVLQARKADDSAVIVEIAGKEFFYWMAPDVYNRLLSIERLDRSVSDLAASMPDDAIGHYIAECLVDEVVLTNDIEGVISTRKEIELAMEALRRNDRRKRFQGILNKYLSLARGDMALPQSCEDIRALYDDLVYDEVVSDDPSKAPDGELFRAGPVKVVDAAQRIVHESAMPEGKVRDELLKGLEIYNDKDVEPLVRAALFHFIFAYIHPFYDGNGRMNRFMSSGLIYSESSRWAGLRLSFSVKENISSYYKAFKLVEHPLDKGDLTPFIVTFLDIVVDALRKTNDALRDKNTALERMRKNLAELFGADGDVDVEGVGEALLHATLFTARGFTAEDISKDADISLPTVYKRLEGFKKKGILTRKRPGRKVYFSLDEKKLRRAGEAAD